MTAKEFYDKRLSEDPTIGSVQLMEEFAKHIIIVNFCDGSPNKFSELSIGQLNKTNEKINLLVNWVNE